MQDHPADELDIKMALAKRAFRRLAYRGEGRHEDVVEALAGCELGLERIGSGADSGQILVVGVFVSVVYAVISGIIAGFAGSMLMKDKSR